MSTKIKLMRRGKTRQPYYRIVVADSRTKRDGRSIEEIGKYHPKEDPSYMEVDSDRVAYWLGVGAQPTDAVRAILRVTGDWQKFYGEPAPEPMLVKAPKPDRRAAFAAATQLGAGGEPEADAATTPKKKATKSAEAKSDDKTGAKVGAKTEPKADAKAEAKADAQSDDTSGKGILQAVVDVVETAVEKTVEKAAEVVDRAVGTSAKGDKPAAKGSSV